MIPEIDNVLKYGGMTFEDAFATTYTPETNDTLYENAYNGWNYKSYSGSPSRCGIGPNNGYFGLATNQIFSTATGSGYNWSYTNVNRNLENYDLNRDFDLEFSYQNLMGQNGNGNPQSSCQVSICGDPATNALWGLCGGLEFKGYTIGAWTSYGSFQVLHNRTVVGTPYSGNIPRSNSTKAWVFVEKRGNKVGVTVNTTGIKPETPAFTYTITDDFVALSNSAIMYQSTQGAGDDTGQSCMDDFKIQFY